MKKIHCGMERFVRAALGAYIDVKCPAESILSKTGTHRLTAPHTRLVLRIVGIKMLLMIFPFTLHVTLFYFRKLHRQISTVLINMIDRSAFCYIYIAFIFLAAIRFI